MSNKSKRNGRPKSKKKKQSPFAGRRDPLHRGITKLFVAGSDDDPSIRFQRWLEALPKGQVIGWQLFSSSFSGIEFKAKIGNQDFDWKVRSFDELKEAIEYEIKEAKKIEASGA